MAYLAQMNEAKRYNEKYVVTYYSFKKERVFTEEFDGESDASKFYARVKDLPKILSFGDAIIRAQNYGREGNLKILKETFRDERDQIK